MCAFPVSLYSFNVLNTVDLLIREHPFNTDRGWIWGGGVFEQAGGLNIFHTGGLNFIPCFTGNHFKYMSEKAVFMKYNEFGYIKYELGRGGG